MTLLIGHDAEVAAWMQAKLGVPLVPPFTAFGVLDDAGTLIGGALFNCDTRDDIELTIYGPGATTPEALRYGSQYCFLQTNHPRMSASVRRSNRHMLRFMEACGFKLEGVKRMPDSRDDILLFGMLKNECKWLPGGKADVAA